MHRFYCPNTNFKEPTLTISDPKELHHLKNVLRLKTSDEIIVFNGAGREAKGVIQTISQRQAVMNIRETRTESLKSFTLMLACATPKKSKFEIIIEKCTELGVDTIIPLQTERTEIILSGEHAAQKLERYRTVAVNAAKQSGRKTVPEIYPQLSLEKVFKDFLTPDTIIFFPCLSGERKPLAEILHSLNRAPKHILIFIGPEGDFTNKEVSFALRQGAIPVTLGKQTLKVETAAITTVGFISLYLN